MPTPRSCPRHERKKAQQSAQEEAEQDGSRRRIDHEDHAPMLAQYKNQLKLPGPENQEPTQNIFAR